MESIKRGFDNQPKAPNVSNELLNSPFGPIVIVWVEFNFNVIFGVLLRDDPFEIRVHQFAVVRFYSELGRSMFDNVWGRDLRYDGGEPSGFIEFLFRGKLLIDEVHLDQCARKENRARIDVIDKACEPRETDEERHQSKVSPRDGDIHQHIVQIDNAFF